MMRNPTRGSCHTAHNRKNQQAFTLVELLVVLTIVGLVASMAIPGLASMGAFARDDMRDGTREVYSMIRAARTHAVTYRQNTAVVYVLDNWVTPYDDPNNNQVLSNEQAQRREFQAAGVFMEAPPAPGSSNRIYVPVEGEWGEFRSFPGDTAVLLQDPQNQGNNYYQSARPRFNIEDAMPGDSDTPSIFDLGLEIITVQITYVDDDGEEFVFNLPFPAHVFRSSGRMETVTSKERYTLHFGWSYAAPPEVRLVEPDLEFSPRMANPIQLFRSTGRVRIAT